MSRTTHDYINELAPRLWLIHDNDEFNGPVEVCWKDIHHGNTTRRLITPGQTLLHGRFIEQVLRDEFDQPVPPGVIGRAVALANRVYVKSKFLHLAESL